MVMSRMTYLNANCKEFIIECPVVRTRSTERRDRGDNCPEPGSFLVKKKRKKGAQKLLVCNSNESTL